MYDSTTTVVVGSYHRAYSYHCVLSARTIRWETIPTYSPAPTSQSDYYIVYRHRWSDQLRRMTQLMTVETFCCNAYRQYHTVIYDN